MRIGLSAGPVIAGVVGAQKPLYDIWGNTVNVASRMDYTGVLGKIQCPDEVAECLERDGISCTFRDIIFVKGKGNMRTHFVDLTEDTHVKTFEPPEPGSSRTYYLLGCNKAHDNNFFVSIYPNEPEVKTSIEDKHEKMLAQFPNISI